MSVKLPTSFGQYGLSPFITISYPCGMFSTSTGDAGTCRSSCPRRITTPCPSGAVHSSSTPPLSWAVALTGVGIPGFRVSVTPSM